MDPTAGLCSVVIPTYNAAPYLAEAIDSALDQTYESVEVIVIDDGSTDDTPAVIEQYGDRIVAIRQPNGGVSSARNTGLARAKGEYIAFLNADDIYAPTRLQRCIELLDTQPQFTLVTTDAYMMDGRTETTRHWYGDFAKAEFPEPADQLQAISNWNYVFVSAVVRREALDRAGPFDSECDRAEDYELWIRFLLDGGRFALIREPLAQCRLLAGSLLDDSAKQWEAHLNGLDKHIDELWRRGVHAQARLYFELARRHARRRDRRRAAALLRMGMQCDDLALTTRVRATAGIALASFR